MGGKFLISILCIQTRLTGLKNNIHGSCAEVTFLPIKHTCTIRGASKIHSVQTWEAFTHKQLALKGSLGWGVTIVQVSRGGVCAPPPIWFSWIALYAWSERSSGSPSRPDLDSFNRPQPV